MNHEPENQDEWNKEVSKAIRHLSLAITRGVNYPIEVGLEPFHILMNNIDAYAFRSEYAAAKLNEQPLNPYASYNIPGAVGNGTLVQDEDE